MALTNVSTTKILQHPAFGGEPVKNPRRRGRLSNETPSLAKARQQKAAQSLKPQAGEYPSYTLRYAAAKAKAMQGPDGELLRELEAAAQNAAGAMAKAIKIMEMLVKRQDPELEELGNRKAFP